MSSCSAAHRSRRRCLWLVLFAVCWTTAAQATDYGSGVVIGPHEILTAAHVVKDCTTVRVFERSADVIAKDVTNDVAVVHTNDEWDHAVLFRNGQIRIGEKVVAMGFPLHGMLADSVNLTVGNVSSLAGINNNSTRLQISTPIQPGNSGGPLVDDNGRLVGITARLLARRMLILPLRSMLSAHS